MKKHAILTPDGRIIRGRWDRVRIWHNQEDLDAYRAGQFVLPMAQYAFPNGITDVGIHYLLEVGFRSDAGVPVSQEAPWYAGLIDDSGYTGVDPSDTMSSHSGWSEATAYDETVRQTLSFGAAATRSITAEVSFTMNATKTIRGIFVVSNSTKSGTTGTLWSTALFASPPGLVSGNVLTANYTLSD